MSTLDARGRPCPAPVTMTKALVDKGEQELEILLDNPISASNVTRFLKGQGYDVLLKDDDGLLSVLATKKTEKPISPIAETAAIAPQNLKSSAVAVDIPPQSQRFSVLITCQHLGQSDQQLGEVLMKSLLGTLPQLENLPTTVALMNEGVKLALFDTSTCDHLKTMEQKGVSVLVCGTCVNHFSINDQIGVGVISNMFEILEMLNKADKVITL